MTVRLQIRRDKVFLLTTFFCSYEKDTLFVIKRRQILHMYNIPFIYSVKGRTASCDRLVEASPLSDFLFAGACRQKKGVRTQYSIRYTFSKKVSGS